MSAEQKNGPGESGGGGSSKKGGMKKKNERLFARGEKTRRLNEIKREESTTRVKKGSYFVMKGGHRRRLLDLIM